MTIAFFNIEVNKECFVHIHDYHLYDQDVFDLQYVINNNADDVRTVTFLISEPVQWIVVNIGDGINIYEDIYLRVSDDHSLYAFPNTILDDVGALFYQHLIHNRHFFDRVGENISIEV